MKKFMLSLFLVPFCTAVFSQAHWSDTAFVHRNGSEIYDGSNQTIRLEGVNLGGWLMWEGWIWGGGFTQEKTIFNRIETKIGLAGANAFRDSIHQNFITKNDFQRISEQCYNIVRVPFNHTLLEDDASPFIYKQEGWDLLDSILSWGEMYNIYILLDLHSAPGGQSNSFTVDPDTDNLWEDQLNKDRTVALWKAIAERYQDRGIVAGYDLLNEPNAPVAGDLVSLYDVIIDSIRTVDTNHMLFIEGNNFAIDFSMFSVLPDPNMLFEFHFYTWFMGPDYTTELMDYTNLSGAYNVPVWCGEWGENNYSELGITIDLFRNDLYKIRGSAFWTWKKAKEESQYPFYYGIDTTADWSKSINWISNIFAPAPTVSEMQNGITAFLQEMEIANCQLDNTIESIVRACGWIGIEENLEDQELLVYPNPFSTSFLIRVNKVTEFTEVKLFDSTGRLVKTFGNFYSCGIVIDREDLPSGIYFYTVCESGVVVHAGKIIAD